MWLKKLLNKGWEINMIVIIHKYGNLHGIYLRNIKNIMSVYLSPAMHLDTQNLMKPDRVSISPGNVAVGNIVLNTSIVQCKQITMSFTLRITPTFGVERYFRATVSICLFQVRFWSGEVLINLNSKEFGTSDLFNLKIVNKYFELGIIIFLLLRTKQNKVCFINVWCLTIFW